MGWKINRMQSHWYLLLEIYDDGVLTDWENFVMEYFERNQKFCVFSFSQMFVCV